MDIITKDYAKANGLNRYFTGKECLRGHICERNMSGACVECTKINQKKWCKANPEKLYTKCKKWRTENPEKNKEKFQKWATNNPEKVKQANRKCKGIPEPTRAEPKTCEICGNPENGKGRWGIGQALSVDHNHSTGKFRGWLCGNCNRALGLLKDSEETIQNMLNYLKNHNERYNVA